MKRLIFILSLFCSVVSAQKILVIDTNTGKEYVKEFPSATKNIPGLAKNLKVYFIVEKEKPSYDYLTERLEKTRILSDSISNGNLYPYCFYDWNVVKLPEETILANKEAAVIQKEIELLMSSVNDQDFKMYVSIALAALIYENRGGTLTTKQNEIIDKVFNFGYKAYQNYVVKEQLMNDIKIDSEIDINQNWIK